VINLLLSASGLFAPWLPTGSSALWAATGGSTQLEPGLGSSGHRVSDYVRVGLGLGSKLFTYRIQTRYRDLVAEGTTEWYSIINTRADCAKSRLNEHTL